MPRPVLQLSPRERQELGRWVAKMDALEARRADLRRGFAAWVRKVGLSAVAREMGLNKQTLDERLRNYEGRR